MKSKAQRDTRAAAMYELTLETCSAVSHVHKNRISDFQTMGLRFAPYRLDAQLPHEPHIKKRSRFWHTS